MIPMLLVVGSLVPASDSPGLAAAPRASAVGVSVRAANQIKLGMTIDQVDRLLGKVKPEELVVGPSEVFHVYRSAGVWIELVGQKVVQVHRFNPTK
jgi:hypothetical protein